MKNMCGRREGMYSRGENIMAYDPKRGTHWENKKLTPTIESVAVIELMQVPIPLE